MSRTICLKEKVFGAFLGAFKVIKMRKAFVYKAYKQGYDSCRPTLPFSQNHLDVAIPAIRDCHLIAYNRPGADPRMGWQINIAIATFSWQHASLNCSWSPTFAMNSQITNRPLLEATGQRVKLFRAVYIFVASFMAICLSNLAGNSLPFSWMLFVVGLPCIFMTSAVAYSVIAIRCPTCGLAWVRWSISHQPYPEWLHWLVGFSVCPKCGHTESIESTAEY
jgi:hypothetical protein